MSTDLGAGAPICTEHRKLDLGNSLVIGVGSCYDSPWRAYAGRAINGRRITVHWRRQIHRRVDATCEGRNALPVGRPGKDALPVGGCADMADGEGTTPWPIGRWRHCRPCATPPVIGEEAVGVGVGYCGCRRGQGVGVLPPPPSGSGWAAAGAVGVGGGAVAAVAMEKAAEH